MQTPSTESLKRRQILSGLMKLLAVIGFILISIPFFSSFSTSSTDEKQSSKSNWVTTVPVADLVTGEIKKLAWLNDFVWVYARTTKDIEALTTGRSLLRDADSGNSDQPDTMRNDFRSASHQFFVFIPRENKKGCQVSLSHDDENVLFIEPCFNARYDSAGRILKNSGHKEQQNLAVPKHIIEAGILKIGVWTPKI